MSSFLFNMSPHLFGPAPLVTAPAASYCMTNSDSGISGILTNCFSVLFCGPQEESLWQKLMAI